VFKTASGFYLNFTKERVKRHFLISNVPTGFVIGNMLPTGYKLRGSALHQPAAHTSHSFTYNNHCIVNYSVTVHILCLCSQVHISDCT